MVHGVRKFGVEKREKTERGREMVEGLVEEAGNA